MKKTLVRGALGACILALMGIHGANAANPEIAEFSASADGNVNLTWTGIGKSITAGHQATNTKVGSLVMTITGSTADDTYGSIVLSSPTGTGNGSEFIWTHDGQNLKDPGAVPTVKGTVCMDTKDLGGNVSTCSKGIGQGNLITGMQLGATTTGDRDPYWDSGESGSFNVAVNGNEFVVPGRYTAIFQASVTAD